MKSFLKLLLAILIIAFDLYPRNEYEPSGLTNNKRTSVINVENRVHRAGYFWMNITNTGIFGNPDMYEDPCTGTTAVSGEMPGGSGTDFLFQGSMFFGGYLNSGMDSGTGSTVFEGPYVSTAYEGWTGEGGVSDMPRECWPVMFAEDETGSVFGHIKETSNVEGSLNCLYEEVYDPSATAEEQFNVMYTDKYVDRPLTGMDDYDNREHIPLGIEVRQKSYAWSYDYAKKFIIADMTIYNRNTEGKDIYDFFIGLQMDHDIGMTGGEWQFCHSDDIGGFIQKWDNYIDPATGEQKTVDLNLAWAADNDGRNYTGQNYYTATGEPGAGEPLDGATSIASVSVLRNPNPNLKYAFNMYIPHSIDESIDWGPRWKTGLHSDWQYDLTPEQKGYDDTNHDGLTTNGNSGPDPLYGGRTEGRPIGDAGKYMVMSNGEFDYEQYRLRELYLGLLEDPAYMEGTPYAQADKWQNWTTADDVGQEGFGEVPDGDIPALNDIANGTDVRYLLSFGPLGTETTEDVAVDADNDGAIDSSIGGKKVWRFAHGDSLKLTLAFVVSENFHTYLEQDPNYTDNTVVDLNDGLDPTLYDKGWYDALYNVLWVQRMYDIPMYDTPVNRFEVTKGDGWYGEDVGQDGIFADISGDKLCWWFDKEYTGPDEGESDFELTLIDDPAVPSTDIYGNSFTSEDDILPFGREQESPDGTFGITGDAVYGDAAGYGCMVRYSKENGYYPEGTWVRYGFDNSKLDAGDGVPDFTGPPPPPSPEINAYFDGNDVIIEWTSHCIDTLNNGDEIFTGPEHFIDKFSRLKDFESYTVMVSPTSTENNFIKLITIDKTNYIYENVGQNGDFYDSPVGQEIYDSLMTAGENIITAEGKIWILEPYGNNTGLDAYLNEDGLYELLVDQRTVAVNGTDTDVRDYRLVLKNRYLENISYVSVVSSDYGDPRAGIPATTSNFRTNMKDIKAIMSSEDNIPITTQLYQNYPNPFNPETKIQFSIKNNTNAELSVYNVTGQKVAVLLNKKMVPGYYSVKFNAGEFNSGLYFYTLKTGSKKLTRKMLLIK